MNLLNNFPSGTKVRHEAYVRTKKISTLYGVIRNNYIETDELGKHQTFHDPYDFIKEHKKAKITNERYRSIRGNPLKIIEYWDDKLETWCPLYDYPTHPVHPTRHNSLASTEVDTSLINTDDTDDTDTFISCISEIDDDELENNDPFANLPYRVTFEHVETLHVWEWKLWATQEYMDIYWQTCYELIQDDININEIEDEMDYIMLDDTYPLITRHNLPYEEELWFALRIRLPQFGEVWMDGWGHCWEITEVNGCMANAGKWIGRWSWDSHMMNLGYEEPCQLVDDEEFWDILQEFYEQPA